MEDFSSGILEVSVFLTYWSKEKAPKTKEKGKKTLSDWLPVNFWDTSRLLTPVCFWRCSYLVSREKMENDNDLKSHHLTPYGKASRTNLLQLLTLCIWLCKHIWMIFFHPHFHVWKITIIITISFVVNFPIPGTTKMKHEYSSAYSLYF